MFKVPYLHSCFIYLISCHLLSVNSCHFCYQCKCRNLLDNISPSFMSVNAYASSSVCSVSCSDGESFGETSSLPPCLQCGHSSCINIMLASNPHWQQMTQYTPPYTCPPYSSPPYSSPFSSTEIIQKTNTMPGDIPSQQEYKHGSNCLFSPSRQYDRLSF